MTVPVYTISNCPIRLVLRDAATGQERVVEGDLITLAMKIDELGKEGKASVLEWMRGLADYLSELAGQQVSVSQAWQVMTVVQQVYAEKKRVFDDMLKSPTTTE
jgi:hypothetical protein